MIDSVTLYQTIPIDRKQLKIGMWQERSNKHEEHYFYRKLKDVTVLYYQESHRMIISGKIITLVQETGVLNLDDLYGNDIERFLDDVNRQLNLLFTEPVIDVRYFRVSRIDYCFNV